MNNIVEPTNDQMKGGQNDSLRGEIKVKVVKADSWHGPITGAVNHYCTYACMPASKNSIKIRKKEMGVACKDETCNCTVFPPPARLAVRYPGLSGTRLSQFASYLYGYQTRCGAKIHGWS
jgi:hypothetical protein